MKTLTQLWFLSLFFLLAALPASAQTKERDIEKENVIRQKLQAVAPDSVETFKAATSAMDNADYKEAARLYEEVIQKAPKFSPAVTCRRRKAIRHCSHRRTCAALNEVRQRRN